MACVRCPRDMRRTWMSIKSSISCHSHSSSLNFTSSLCFQDLTISLPPSPSPSSSWVVLSLFSSYRLHDRSASTWNNKALNVVFIPSAAHQRVICTLLPCFHAIRQISKEKSELNFFLEIHPIIAWPLSNFCLKDCFFILQFLVNKPNNEPDSDYG